MPDKATSHLSNMLIVKVVYKRVKADKHIMINLTQYYQLWNKFYSCVSTPAVSFHSSKIGE